MRISDWSSDVCSSDLGGGDGRRRFDGGARRDAGGGDRRVLRSGAAAPAAGRLGSGCRARDRRYSAGGRRPGRCGRFDMTLSSLPQWLRPAPDSVVAIDIRVGKSPWVEAVHLMWSIWVFITPTFAGGYTLRWALLTLGSYPLFVLLYALCLVLPRRIASRPAYGLIALCLVLLPWYPSGISYFIFGCVMLRMHCTQSTFVYIGQLLLANVLFLAAALWIGYPWQSVAWTPVMTLVIGLVVNVERATKEHDAEIRLSHDEVRRHAATAERERIGRDLHALLGHTQSLNTLTLELSSKIVEGAPTPYKAEWEDR